MVPYTIGISGDIFGGVIPFVLHEYGYEIKIESE